MYIYILEIKTLLCKGKYTKNIYCIITFIEDWQKEKLIHGNQGWNSGGVLTKWHKESSGVKEMFPSWSGWFTHRSWS